MQVQQVLSQFRQKATVKPKMAPAVIEVHKPWQTNKRQGGIVEGGGQGWRKHVRRGGEPGEEAGSQDSGVAECVPHGKIDGRDQL